MPNDTNDSAFIKLERPPEPKVGRSKPTKSLPTERISVEKQLHVLRGYAKASKAVERGAVSNNDVARYADMSPSSVSICNPFWNEIGLVVREGMKQRPTDVVFEFDQAFDWNKERAPGKLATVFMDSWIGRALMPKLSMKSASVDDVLEFLAEECSAPVDYRDGVRLLLDYMVAVGLVFIENNLVSKNTTMEAAVADATPPIKPDAPDVLKTIPFELPKNVKRFAIPIPDKEDAVITLPENLDEEDWEMVEIFLKKYVERWKGFGASAPKTSRPPSVTLNHNGETR
jgi:hypothetical protein